MAEEEQVKRLKEGVDSWNQWIAENPNILIDLSGINLCGTNLSNANFRGVDFGGANLNRANLKNSDLSNADLFSADLSNTNLVNANLRNSDLRNSDLRNSDLRNADLSNACLNDATISDNTQIEPKWKLVHNLVNGGVDKVDLSGLDLSSANLQRAKLRHTNLRNANLSYSNLKYSDLRYSDLSSANLNFTDLSGADLSGATLNGTNLNGTYISKETRVEPKWKLLYEIAQESGVGRDLSGAILNNVILKDAQLSGANLSGSNLSGADLSGADLSNANLSGSNLSGADLSNANLSGADLYNSSLLASKLLNANLTGSCITDWNTNAETKFDGVICEYIYRGLDESKRLPVNPRQKFNPGEFEHWIRISAEAQQTIDLTFTDGIDWQAFFQSLQGVHQEYPNANVSIQAIEEKGTAFVIRLKTSPDADKGAIETKAKELYGDQLKALEEEFMEKMKLQGATLESVQESLVFERQRNTQLLSMVATMANKDKVTQNFNAQVGNVAGVNEGNQQTTQHNYAPEIKQTPAESAKEIQDLLSQLQKTNPTDIQTVVVQRIKTDPTFRQRLQNALKEGGVETMKVLFAPIGIPIEMVRGWIEAEGN